MKIIQKPRFPYGFSMISGVRGTSKSTKNLQNRARRALEHQRTDQDGQDGLEQVDKCLWIGWTSGKSIAKKVKKADETFQGCKKSASRAQLRAFS